MNSLSIPWQKLLLVLLPTVAGLIVLWFRSVHVFALSQKVWGLFIVAGLVIALVGWLRDRRIPIPALPTFGIVLFVLFRTYLNPIIVNNPDQRFIAYFILMVALGLYTWQLARRTQWRTWGRWIVALPLASILTKLASIAADGGWPLRAVFMSLTMEFTVAGLMAFLILAGLPFAHKYGVKAVLIILGFLLFIGIGQTSAFSSDILQRAFGALYILTFLFVIPLISGDGSSQRRERLAIFVPITLLYAVTILGQGLDDGWNSSVLHGAGEAVQTLIGLFLAMEIYSRLESRKAPEFLPVQPATLDAAGV